MSLSFSRSSPTNFDLTRVVIQASVITSPVLLKPSFVLSTTFPAPSLVFSPTFSAPSFVFSAPSLVLSLMVPAVPLVAPGRLTTILLSTRAMPLTLASVAALARLASVGTVPVSVATPPLTSTSMLYSLSVASLGFLLSIWLSSSLSDSAGLACGTPATAEVALNPLIATAQIRLPRNAFMVITPFTVELCAARRADRRGELSNPRTSSPQGVGHCIRPLGAPLQLRPIRTKRPHIPLHITRGVGPCPVMGGFDRPDDSCSGRDRGSVMPIWVVDRHTHGLSSASKHGGISWLA